MPTRAQAPIAPLKREDVVAVIEGRGGAPRVPIQIHLWVHPETFEDRRPAVEEILRHYPQDVQMLPLSLPDVHAAPPDDPEFCWLPFDDPGRTENGALDAIAGMPDWSRLPETLERIAALGRRDFLPAPPAPDARYRLGHWWFCLFERHWSLRGMSNALTDFFEHPEKVHALYRALTDLYKIMIDQMHRAGADGFMTSDDLGTQKAPFFSADVFREFFKPYYRELADFAHQRGMHFWMHACGDVTEFIEDWIDAGLDVLHPVQKFAMDETAVARRFAGRICFFAGLDVQQTIPWGSPDTVRAEVRRLLDLFWRPGAGGCVLTAGNGINEDCAVVCLEAFFEEAVRYGEIVARESSKA